MNTIIVNTLTGAVSEYTNFAFDGLTATQAGGPSGLYNLVGDTDATTPIVSHVISGKKLWGTSLNKFIDMVYFALKGAGTGMLEVIGESAAYQYNFPVDTGGESRCKPGRGIRENYLAFGYSNADGGDFQLDAIEIAVVQSTTRRTS
jgi:hypothetical protein